MSGKSSNIVSYIDDILNLENPSSNIKILLVSLNTYLRSDTDADNLKALKHILLKLKNASADNHSAYLTLLTVIVSHLLGRDLNENDKKKFIYQLNYILNSDFNKVFVTLFNLDKINNSLFSDELLHAIFEKIEFSDIQNNSIKLRKARYDETKADSYVNTVLNYNIYLEEPNLTQRHYLFSYLKRHCTTKDKLLAFQTNLLSNIHAEGDITQYGSDLKKPYKTVLGFMLCVTFPLLQSKDETFINAFIERPYDEKRIRILQTVSLEDETPEVQSTNRVWLFCQRHPYLVGFGLALALMGIVAAGLASFGLVPALMAAPIVTAVLGLALQGALTVAFSLIVKRVSERFVAPQIEPAFEDASPDLNFNHDLYFDNDSNFNNAFNTNNIITTFNANAKVAYQSTQRDQDDLIARFTTKTTKHPVRRTRKVRKEMINEDESTPLLSPRYQQ